jgi:hypothetical protein
MVLKQDEGLADERPLTPFVYPGMNHPGLIVFCSQSARPSARYDLDLGLRVSWNKRDVRPTLLEFRIPVQTRLYEKLGLV